MFSLNPFDNNPETGPSTVFFVEEKTWKNADYPITQLKMFTKCFKQVNVLLQSISLMNLIPNDQFLFTIQPHCQGQLTVFWKSWKISLV